MQPSGRNLSELYLAAGAVAQRWTPPARPWPWPIAAATPSCAWADARPWPTRCTRRGTWPEPRPFSPRRRFCSERRQPETPCSTPSGATGTTTCCWRRGRGTRCCAGQPELPVGQQRFLDLLDIALDDLARAGPACWRAIRRRPRPHLGQAVDGLRRAGQQDMLPWACWPGPPSAREQGDLDGAPATWTRRWKSPPAAACACTRRTATWSSPACTWPPVYGAGAGVPVKARARSTPPATTAATASWRSWRSSYLTILRPPPSGIRCPHSL